MLFYRLMKAPKSRERNQQIDLELFFSALADRTRLRLLNLMAENEVCVCFLVEIIGPNQPKISRHLAYLRKAGIVAARREGKWMHYRIIEPDNATAQTILRDLRAALKSDPEMLNDRRRLTGLCCRPKIPAHLAAAPKPQPCSCAPLES
jgi:ArsR family transcriptional regulator